MWDIRLSVILGLPVVNVGYTVLLCFPVVSVGYTVLLCFPVVSVLLWCLFTPH